MGNSNAAHVVNANLVVPGFRLNPKIVFDFDSLAKDPNNKLWAEFQEATIRLN